MGVSVVPNGGQVGREGREGTNGTAASDDRIMEEEEKEARRTLACQPNDHNWLTHRDLANRLDLHRRQTKAQLCASVNYPLWETSG